jgi:hypothetical protein
MRASMVVLGCLCLSGIACAADAIDATTAQGDRVRLLPNGRWEYVDAKKAETQKAVVDAYDKAHDDEKALEQGGLFGVGRKVKPGDPEYNRGSLGGKTR